MKQRLIKNKTDRDKAISALMLIEFPYVLSVSREKQRSESQNSMYWAHIEEWLVEINKYIDAASDSTGYTNFEVRKLVASEMGWPKSAMLSIIKKEAAHEIMKVLCGVPTSVRLGTKEFQKFNGIMDATFADILGSVKQITGKMIG